MAQETRKTSRRDNGIEDRWEDRSRLLRAIAHPVRLRILEALSESSQCVKDLNSLIPIVQPHLSQHMAALRKVDLVACHSCGALRCYYLLRPTLVKKLIQILRQEHPPSPRDRRTVLQEARRHEKAQLKSDLQLMRGVDDLEFVQ